MSDSFTFFGRIILDNNQPILLDIGGAAGLQPHWNRFLGNSKIVFFEPHPQSFEDLKGLYLHTPHYQHMVFIPHALSQNGGTRDFFQTNCPTGSSLYEPRMESPYVQVDDPYFFPLTRRQIETKSLSDCLDKYQIPFVDGMKLDIQGAELEVIKGLDKNRLENCLLIESEVGLSDIYHGATSFPALRQYLEDNHFDLFDIKSNRAPLRIPGTLNYYCEQYLKVDYHCPAVSSKVYELDIVLFKNIDFLIQRQNISQIRKIIFCYCVYNFFSEAFYALERTLQNNLLTQVEADGIGQAVADWHSLVRAQLRELEEKLRSSDHMVWSQYTWVPYPCT